MIHEYMTKEGFVIKKLHTICPLSERDVAFEINKDSPFYKVCPNNDENCPEFELLVLFQG